MFYYANFVFILTQFHELQYTLRTYNALLNETHFYYDEIPWPAVTPTYRNIVLL